MARKYTPEEEQFIKDNVKYMQLSELAKALNRPETSVFKKIHKMGIKLKEVHGTYWTVNEDNTVKEHFCYAPKNYLMKLLPLRSWKSIFHRGNGMGLQRNSQDKYFIDYNFFKDWSHEAAYILGFIVADGYIKIDTCGSRHANLLQFELADYDVDVLEKIKKATQFEGPIKISNRKTCRLQINNTKIIQDIISKGVPAENKTINASAPLNMPKEYDHDFVRGVFDGDGSIYVDTSSGYDRLTFQVLGSKKLLEAIRQMLPIYSEESYISYRGKAGANIYVMSIKNKSTIDIYNWMYNNSTIHMNRKYEKYLSYRNQFSVIRETV